MKHLIIYHAHCLDGFGAAWAAYTGLQRTMKMDDTLTLLPASYGDPFPTAHVDSETAVHIVDFSYPPPVIIAASHLAAEINILDHHKTAICAYDGITLPPNVFTVFDMNRSGAVISWQFYHPVQLPVPKMLQHIQDRDLWKFEMMNTKPFCLNLGTFEQSITTWGAINAAIELEGSGEVLEPGYYDEFIVCGLAIQRFYDKTIASIIATTKVRVIIDGKEGLGCNCNGMFASDIGNILSQESGTFGLTWNEDNQGNEKISLRSIGDYDVSEIAKSFGGGGHRNAAGLTLALDDREACKRIQFRVI